MPSYLDPTFDPPEYVAAGEPGSAAVRAWDAVLDRAPDGAARRALVDTLDEATRLALWRGLVRARFLDHALARLVLQGHLSKAWLATGEEAATVGPVRGVMEDGTGASAPATPAPFPAAGPIVAPLIRNLAACLEMGMPMVDVLRAHLGTADGPSGGRDLHVGDAARGILAPISHLGDLVPVITGVALAMQRATVAGAPPRVALTWFGDGASKTGAVHEGLVLAAALGVPALFVLQDNGVALGTPRAVHHRGRFDAWPAAYGMRGAVADGNHVLDTWAAARLLAAGCRAGEGPALLVLETFRMGGHASHDAADARRLLGDAAFAAWGDRDPLRLYGAWLRAGGTEAAVLHAIVDAERRGADDASEAALASRRDRMPDPRDALGGVVATDGGATRRDASR